MRVTFGPWTPDLADLDVSALEECVNCMPLDSGFYGPLKGNAVFSQSISGVGAVIVRGAFATTDFDTYKFQVGTGNSGGINKLWGIKADATVTDLSRTAGYSTSTEWSFTRFGAHVLAANGANALQYVTLSSKETQYTDMSASASAPTCARVCTVRDFVFAGRLLSERNKVQWSQINNALRWTASPRLQSDSQVLPDCGDVVTMTGGDFACILTERSIWRATYVGSPIIFRFDEVAPGVGCLASGSAARFQNLTFFLSQSGFQLFDGQQVLPIGRGKIDRWFFDRFDAEGTDGLGVANTKLVSSTIDPYTNHYCISFPHTDGTFRILLYHWTSQRWAVAAFTNVDSTGVKWICSGGDFFAPGIADGGQLSIAAFDSLSSPVKSRLLSFTSSTILSSYWITGEAQIFKDRRAFVQAVRPLVQAAAAPAITTQVGKRNRLDESVTYTSAVAANANGLCPVRADARYHRVRTDISGSFTHAIGFDLTAKPSGAR